MAGFSVRAGIFSSDHIDPGSQLLADYLPAHLHGNVADLGEAGRNGAQIAVEEINRAGGINGRQVELIVMDVHGVVVLGGLDGGFVDWIITKQLFGISYAFYVAVLVALVIWYVFEYTPQGKKVWEAWVNVPYVGMLHDYQRKRVLTLLDPSEDPLGAGYHIIQATIAIGSGGLFGKGWLAGTQAKLDFLPESHTDFIFAVYSEELGLLGVAVLMALYAAIVGRGLYIALRGQDSFQRLLAGSLAMTFFVYVFINMGMVIGLLPVVGVPLPLVSFGGTSAVTLLAGFGMLMSVYTHRKLLSN